MHAVELNIHNDPHTCFLYPSRPTEDKSKFRHTVEKSGKKYFYVLARYRPSLSQVVAHLLPSGIANIKLFLKEERNLVIVLYSTLLVEFLGNFRVI